MKYKVGDRVEIKKDDRYCYSIQERLQEINYVGMIIRVEDTHYILEEFCAHWRDYHIIGLVLSTKEFFEPIITRFEMMEL